MCDNCDRLTGEVLMLREALETSPNHGDYCEGADDSDSCGYCQWFNRRKEVLSTTLATAQQRVEAIRREAVEKVWARVLAAPHRMDGYWHRDDLEASILGEEEG